MLDRRIVLAALVGLMTAASTRAHDSEGPSRGLLPAWAFVGSWEVTLTPEAGGPPPFRALFTFHADGTVVESDAGPPSPQLFTPGHGAWQQTGPREFTVIYRQINFDEQANLTGLFKGRVKFKLNRARTEISGPTIVDFYDPLGVLVFTGAGTAQGTRIKVEPLD